MITLGIIFILISLFFEHLANKDIADGVAVSDSYNKTVRIMNKLGKIFFFTGLIFWAFFFVIIIFAGIAS